MLIKMCSDETCSKVCIIKSGRHRHREKQGDRVWNGFIFHRIDRDQWQALVNTVMNLQVP
jgi:hypothetical protein